MTGAEPTSSPTGSQSAAISDLTVRLLSQYTGRGPTKARTFFNDDLVTVVLQDTLTTGEVSLVGHDRGEMVLATRKTFQDVMGADLIAGVQRILQREVTAFLSANHIDPDIAVETFLLAPIGDGSAPSRGKPGSATGVHSGDDAENDGG